MFLLVYVTSDTNQKIEKQGVNIHSTAIPFVLLGKFDLTPRSMYQVIVSFGNDYQ